MSATAPLGQPSLPVADLDRAIAFYRDVLGLTLEARHHFMAALRTPGGAQRIGLGLRDGGSPGLAALVVPDRPALARAVRRVREAGVPITGGADHGVGEAVYLRDPDGNAVELHRDRPEWEWPDDRRASLNRPLDLDGLLAEA